jgi:predicted transcriptional regulator
MNALTFHVPDEVQQKIQEIAAVKGVSVETLLGDVAATMIEEFEAHRLFLDLTRQGEGEVEEALALLRRP